MPNYSRDIEADRLDWVEDQAIYDDEVTGAAWARAFAAAPHLGAHWPEPAGLDRRLHPVDGDTDLERLDELAAREDATD